MPHGQSIGVPAPMTLERFANLMRRGACPPHRLREGGCATCAEHELAITWATGLLAEIGALTEKLSESGCTVETARRCLSSCAEDMTEHAYQEMASALEAPPRWHDEVSALQKRLEESERRLAAALTQRLPRGAHVFLTHVDGGYAERMHCVHEAQCRGLCKSGRRLEELGLIRFDDASKRWVRAIGAGRR